VKCFFTVTGRSSTFAFIREKKAVIQAKAGPDMVEKRNKEEKNRG
jgi:hypothetical protein